MEVTQSQLRVVVISLPGSLDRRAHIQGQLGIRGVPFEFFDAMEGNVGQQFDAYDERSYLINTGRRVSRGEVGCFASHRAVWRLCQMQGEPVLILEDDAALMTGFRAALTETARLINRCGFIRLQDETRARSRPLVQAGRFTLSRYTKMTQGAMGYAITPAVAAAFLEASSVLVAPVDVFIRQDWRHRQPLYGLRPYTVLESVHARRSIIGGREKTARPLSVRFARLLAKVGWFGHRFRWSVESRRPEQF